MLRRRACTAPSRRRIPSSPTCSSSSCRRSSPRLPGPSARRTASRSRTSGPASRWRWRRSSTRAATAARTSSTCIPRSRPRSTRTSPRPAGRSGWRSRAASTIAGMAVQKGLTVKPWVKTSLAPGSQVVAEYLDKSGLQKDLDKLGYNLVGFGCTTCIGNSGPLAPEISKTINEKDLVAAAVLSGNRNFEGRVNADVRANYLASPPLVVAYALAGSMYSDLVKQPLGIDKKGKKVFLRDIWPSSREISGVIRKTLSKQMFTKKYADVFKGDSHWRGISVKGGLTYNWDRKSTYVQNPPYFVGMGRHPAPLSDIVDA